MGEQPLCRQSQTTGADVPLSHHFPVLNLGVSACLIGQRVRYDGDDQSDAFCLSQLAPLVRWLPECPEVAIGLGVPRPTIQLQREHCSRFGRRALQNTEPVRDLTDALAQRADDFLKHHPDCDGYLLMERSPSCGLQHTKLYDEQQQLLGRVSRGIFAERLQQLQPTLPLIDAAQLADFATRHHFLSRLYGYRELRSLAAQRVDLHSLRQCWQQHRLLVMACDPHRCQQLDSLLTTSSADSNTAIALWQTALATAPEPSGWHNSLQCAAEMLADACSANERTYLQQQLAACADSTEALLPLISTLRQLSAQYRIRNLLCQRLLYGYPQSLFPSECS